MGGRVPNVEYATLQSKGWHISHEAKDKIPCPSSPYDLCGLVYASNVVRP